MSAPQTSTLIGEVPVATWALRDQGAGAEDAAVWR